MLRFRSSTQRLLQVVQKEAPGLLSASFRRAAVPRAAAPRVLARQTRSMSTAAAPVQSYREYFLSTHFWGPLANWGFVVAALVDMDKPADAISGPMTTSLAIYSVLFMRFAWMVQPRNMLLFACHFCNCSAQIYQLFRKYTTDATAETEVIAA